MCYIYAADIYCDDCGEDIKRRLAEQFYNTPGSVTLPDGSEMVDFESVEDLAEYLDSMDERDYDSDDYPKGGLDDEETDSPQHCGSHADCINAIELPDGTRIGALISDNLTSYGVEYVKEAVSEGGVVSEFWRSVFDWVDFPGKYTCPICGFSSDYVDDFEGALCLDCIEDSDV